MNEKNNAKGFAVLVKLYLEYLFRKCDFTQQQYSIPEDCIIILDPLDDNNAIIITMKDYSFVYIKGFEKKKRDTEIEFKSIKGGGLAKATVCTFSQLLTSGFKMSLIVKLLLTRKLKIKGIKYLNAFMKLIKEMKKW